MNARRRARWLLMCIFASQCGVQQSNRLAPPPLEHTRHGHRLEVLPDGTWLVLGGFGANIRPGRGKRDCYALRPGTGRWEHRAQLPRGLAFAGSCVAQRNIHAIGGGVWRYEQERDAWVEVIAPGALPESHFGCAAIGDRAYVIGGYPKDVAGARAVDLTRGTVHELPPLPGYSEGDHFHIVVALERELHVIGGIAGSTIASRHFVFDGTRWAELAPAPRPLWTKFAAVATHGSSVWIFDHEGGLRYDAATRGWSQLAGLDGMIAMPAAHCDGTSIHVLGGLDVPGKSQPRLRRYDIASDAWHDVTRGGNTPRGR